MPSFQNFFVSAPASSLLLEGHYDLVLVGLSVLVAILSSYGALLVSQHVLSKPSLAVRRMWITGGGLCLGAGIWAMHFIGMLAFELPCTTGYDTTLTLISTVPGILASVLVVNTISHRHISTLQLLNGGTLFGAGVGAMHYTGMSAMRINGLIRYDAAIFSLSILVAVVLAVLALWLKFRLQRRNSLGLVWINLSSAVVMGLAVSGMHYTAMLAAYFVSDSSVDVASGIDPSFLAMIVLLLSGLIVVATIFATFIELPSLASMKRSLRIVTLLVIGWIFLAWLGTNNYYAKLSNTYYQRESDLAAQQIVHVANTINLSLQALRGIPRVLAAMPQTHASLQIFGPDVAASNLPIGRRAALWQQHPVLRASSQFLAISAANLGADVIWIMNAAGDCVAASNSESPTSFVGGNFADRTYFQKTKLGQRGEQYAVGRISSAPGLYYADPVYLNGHFVGAVVVKRNISNFSGWTQQLTAFLTDINGVVILAKDKSWEYLALPDARVRKFSAQDLQTQYQKREFLTLPIQPWSQAAQFPDAKRLGNSDRPWILSSKGLEGETLTVHVAQPLDALARHGTEKLWLFFLVTTAGSLLIVASMAVHAHLRESRRMESEQRVAATAFESQQGMMITNANQVILQVNKAFTELTGYPFHEVVGQTPKLLQSGRHDAAFYAALWQQLRAKGVWQGEIWSRRRNGEVFPEWLLITAVKDTLGQVTHYIGTFSDITARKAAEDEINNLAFYDPLTGLPNRRLLLDRLKHAMAASSRSGQFGAMLFIDLDNFKDLNDSRGHHVGDLLLQQVSGRLVACTREGDTTARLGGDEFVVMLEDLGTDRQAGADHARVVGEKVLASLNQPYQLANSVHHSTPSIGIALFGELQGNLDEVLKRADLAMYQAKASGRNALRFFDPEMQAVVVERAALEDDLRQAIQKQHFTLAYQAQVQQDGKITGAEVLLRWQHATRAAVSPGQFIPLAEETGLILPLGHWVLETACAQLTKWASHKTNSELSISVNVSARQFRHPDFVDQVLAILEHTHANPQRLKIELTESLLVSDVEDIITKMNALKAVGVGFSLDDFGTGYSSLSYLKRLPLDQLKIDQGFVRNILSDPNDAAIARMVIALAESLGLKVIAEGVEQVAQRDFLARLGCYSYQGYLYGRPLPLEQFERLL